MVIQFDTWFASRRKRFFAPLRMTVAGSSS
jgi:hypothetical protein